MYKPFAFTRVLGHKNDMPGSGRWRRANKHNEECWVRGLHCHTLFMWSPEIGAINEANSIQPGPQQKEGLIAQLSEFNKKIGRPLS